MSPEQFRGIVEQANRREATRYAFLRQLLLLAGGALTLLISLGAGGGSAGTGIALWSLRALWVSLGLGILALGVALHGEVWMSAALVRQRLAAQTGTSYSGDYGAVQRPAIYRYSERIAYAALATTVVALACHGIAQSW